ncbi:trypsin-like cysteine/serine peptidase domain-containing protein [Hyaloraphidium curvatum]|nr:trypsin-like cysteine/serine peptidase domain-containing protein [Hyaloraphidium curvatum]
MLFTVSDIQLEDDQSPPVKIFTCGATLIAPRLALTAAHCVDFWEADDVSAAYVQTGRWNRSKTVEEEGGYEYKVVRYEMHPDYVPYVYHNDVAVLYLSDPLVTGTGSPAVIRVNFAEADPAPGSVTKAVGFGEANTDFFLDGDNIRGAPRYLQEVNLTAASNEDCISALNNYTLENWGDPYTEEDFDPSFLCAGDPGKDTCQGDSGGPLMQFMDDGSFAQVGITSWGFGCAETFGVYSRISSFRPWLEYFSHRDHPNDDITHHRDSLVDKDMGHCHADLGAPHALLPPCPERSQLLQHAADLPLGAAGHCFLWRRGRGAPLRCPPLVVGGLHVDQRPVHEHRFPARDARQRDQMRGSHSRCTHDL